MFEGVNVLETKLKSAESVANPQQISDYFRDEIIPVMEKLRKSVDEAETVVGSDYWPYPTYADMLFYI